MAGHKDMACPGGRGRTYEVDLAQRIAAIDVDFSQAVRLV